MAGARAVHRPGKGAAPVLGNPREAYQYQPKPCRWLVQDGRVWWGGEVGLSASSSKMYLECWGGEGEGCDRLSCCEPG